MQCRAVPFSRNRRRRSAASPFVRVHCAQCHAIDKVSDSPLAIAPPFRTLHLKFPIESLRRRLAEGIVADHPTMPQFRLEPDQIADVMAYLQTFEP